ncbi:hypothetical protein [Antrihabitans cavernicola]|uniref:hypothetical protein n=1 Tax=Antrihabitans cavernicola TaxID=2495913 RepID=UPI001F17F0B1|nr:hypothetical protein [Spelaeibacter cavernicola]
MASNFDTDETDTRNGKRQPSAVLLLTGLLTLAVSGWALIGPSALSGFDTNMGWVLVLIAVVAGAVLVFSPSKKRR